MLDITAVNTLDMDSLFGETIFFGYNAKNHVGGPLGTMEQVFHWRVPLDVKKLE
ncbi:MAG: hypothetical protein GY749_35785 [Desulfobacteraceae bacterium]|nr:hypothetical protein [Desulfobacteraceae bacterium]